MNRNNNRHMRYRQSVYRRRSIRTSLIAGGIVLGILLVAFFLLGSLFSDKLEQTPESPKQTQKPDNNPPTVQSVRHVQAPLLSLEGSKSNIYARLDVLQTNGYTAVCIPLTNQKGTLSYRSSLAAGNDYSIHGTSSLSLSDLVDMAHANGTYLCGTYVLRAMEEENELSRSVLLAESAAVIAEAFLAGMNDIVIIVPELPTDRQAEIIRFAENIRTFAPNAILGLSLPESEIAAPDATRIDTLAKSFDFLALNLLSDEKDPVAFAEARMSSMLYYLLRYEMRVILPSLEDEDTQDELFAAVESESIDNWMVLTP